MKINLKIDKLKITVQSIECSTCIGCACTDEHACKGGCHWERVDRSAGVGVCSSCTEHVAAFDAGERRLTRTAKQRVYYRTNRSKWLKGGVYSGLRAKARRA